MKQKLPYFSIVVPTYNRPRQVEACLLAVSCLDYPKDRFEVIVVDDGGEVSPEGAISAVQGQIPVTLIRKKNGGPAAARNTGVAHAKGRFLAFTDDDCCPATYWLKNLAARLLRAPNCIVCGRTLSKSLSSPYSLASQMFLDYLFEYFNANPEHARFAGSGNLAVPKNRFLAIGGFNERFSTLEDREFCYWWICNGYQMIYASDAVVYHAHPLTFGAFWRQHLNYGHGAFHLHLSRSRRDRKQAKLEPFSFYLKLVSYPFYRSTGHRAPVLSMLLVMSQVATAIGFIAEWKKQRKKKAPL